MDFLAFALAGLGLAIDASAVTIANCASYKGKLSKLKEWSMPVAFTFFQILMPILGFYIGSIFADKIKHVSGYVTAGVFFILSLKIVYDNVKELKANDDEKENSPQGELTYSLLVIQGISTSIDALFVGVTYSMTVATPFIPALIIGGVTFLLVTASLLFGKYLGKLFGKYAQWFGALILFALALKSLIETLI